MLNNERKVIVTGGGTGGHVFPGIAIAEELRNRGFQVTYVGTTAGQEARLVPPTGIPFRTIKAGGIKNQGVKQLGVSFFKLFFGLFSSLSLLRQEKPDAVIGVGGYVSGPLCLAAALLRIPVYLQEQNATAGMANQFIGRFARKIFLGFAEAARDFSGDKTVVTGNPIRQMFLRSDFPPYNPRAETLFVFGGSQGARAINEALLVVIERLCQNHPRLKVIHQTGELDFEKVKASYPVMVRDRVEILPFIKDMDRCYAEASLVVSRSGALTVSELIAVGRPALLVPYPRKGKNDQTANAYYLQSQGVAKVVEQGENFAKRFGEALFELLDERLSPLPEMAEKFSSLRKQSAVVTIGTQLEQDLAEKQ